jgi:ribose/xylose/arabinose/galactoside ABC-type transport system permease subunit
VLILPVCLKRIIARYRPLHSGVLQAGQGALLGAFMAVLSFAAFLVFALATVSLQRAAVLDKLRDIAAIAAQNPNPKAQQMALWLPTNEGFIVFVAFSLALALAFFLLAGAISGALITRTKKLP